MNRKLVITKYVDKIVRALFEDDELVELHCDERSLLGNIYIGKVKNIVHNINAAFIEIMPGIECYYAINENPAPIFTNKIEKKPICIGDELLVQVSKEAVKTKVPTVSSNLNFTGKYAVLTTGDCRIGVSSKLNKSEKERLQQIGERFRSDDYGLILRTNAKEASDEIIREEISALISQYQIIANTADKRTCYSCLLQSPSQYLVNLKNIYQDGSFEIIIENEEIYEEVKEYLEANQKEDLQKLHFYQDKLLPLHKLYSIEKHVENALKNYVWLKSGAYLVIQPTEALTVIDVNTGKCVGKKKDERAYLKINMEAAKEVAKQLRLRNLSGIIVIDFINLPTEESLQELLCFFARELEKDPVATTLVDVTKLQLVEVTRKKVSKPFFEAFSEKKIVQNEEDGIQ